MQGACTAAPGAAFTEPTTPLLDGQCIIQVPTRAITIQNPGSRHWISNISFQVSRPDLERDDEIVLADVSASQGRVWFNAVRFLGDGGLVQGIRVNRGARAYVGGAPPLFSALCHTLQSQADVMGTQRRVQTRRSSGSTARSSSPPWPSMRL